jgi:hypothetical protein
MGGFGSSGGGGAPQQTGTPPTLDMQQTLGLTQGGIDLLRKNITPLSEAYGSANRSQETLNRFYGLRSLTDPGEDLGRAMEQEVQPKLGRAQSELDKLRKLKPTVDRKTGETVFRLGTGRNAELLSQDDLAARIAGLESSVTGYKSDLNRARTYDPVTELTSTFADQYGMRDRLLGDMRNTIDSTSEYRRFQEALGRGVEAQTVDRGALGDSLYETAMQRAQSQGQLSPEASRDATQAARSGMAARGMATGSAALGAELLNRDRYSRARMGEDLAFAQGVSMQDLGRRQFNANMTDATNRYNVGLLGQSSALSDAERTRQLMTQQDMYNFAMGTDPRMMLAGLGTPYANMTSPAASSLTAMASTTQPIYSGGSFTPQQMPQMPGYNPWGALALGAAGAGVGYLAGGPTGAFAGFGAGSGIGGQIR